MPHLHTFLLVCEHVFTYTQHNSGDNVCYIHSTQQWRQCLLHTLNTTVETMSATYTQHNTVETMSATYTQHNSGDNVCYIHSTQQWRQCLLHTLNTTQWRQCLLQWEKTFCTILLTWAIWEYGKRISCSEVLLIYVIILYLLFDILL